MGDICTYRVRGSDQYYPPPLRHAGFGGWDPGGLDISMEYIEKINKAYANRIILSNVPKLKEKNIFFFSRKVHL